MNGTLVIAVLMLFCGLTLAGLGLSACVLSSQLSREQERARREWDG